MDDQTLAELRPNEDFVLTDSTDTSLVLGSFQGFVEERSIRVSKLNTPGYLAPDSVYMIYMHFDAQGKFVVKQLSERPFSGTVAEAEGRLLAVARGTSQPAGDLIVEGINFQNIVWKRPHYVTFVIDNPGWKTYWGYNGLGDPIRFLERKPGSTQLYLTDNHTFFDARRVRRIGIRRRLSLYQLSPSRREHATSSRR